MTDIPVGLMSPINSMAEFETRARQIQEYLQGCATVLGNWASSIVGASPVVQASKDAAISMVTVLRTLPPQVGEVVVITRAAQKELWEAHVDNPQPNHQMWVGRR